MYDLTVIIPTFKEESNIGTIIENVDAVFSRNAINGEILIVDDNSPDRTIELVRELQKTKSNLSLVVRKEDYGLSQSVVEGFRTARSDILLVMDADLSHPPALIPVILAGIRDGNDLVIGSRYIEGGGIKKWPFKRRIISMGATLLGRLLFPDISDPVSGFFAVRKSVVTGAQLTPRGYKILLEVLGKGIWENEKEIPFEFSDREIGTSKLKIKTIIEYAQQVVAIAGYSLFHHKSAVWKEWKNAIKFSLVGVSGIVVNEGILISLKEFAGFSIPLASVCAIELSIVNNFIWNDWWTFKTSQGHSLSNWWHRFVVFQIISIGGAFVNFAILITLTLIAGIDYRISNIIGIMIAFAWNFLINRNITWKKAKSLK
ncbi:MAG: glycosyltransferase family 2 protein [Methanoregula sp.]|uniref:glycosyltransferase n=1 Tax=Methanoregula sp. TaxID=2052170 RepID=UPI003BAFEECB